MGVLEAMVFGVIQGLTEFLPISSSGHLVIAGAFFGMEEQGIFFSLCLHFATMFSVLIFFRHEIAGLFVPSGKVWRICIALGTVPAVLTGVLAEKHMSGVFSSPRIVSGMLILTALVLIPAQRFLSLKGRETSAVGPAKALWVGIAQAAAIVPGLSRSGFTISAGLAAGMDGKEAFKFSFLLAVPIIAGATLYEGMSMLRTGAGAEDVNVIFFAVGMFSAFTSGLLGLFFVKRAVVFRKVWVFSVYCFVAGSAGLMFFR